MALSRFGRFELNEALQPQKALEIIAGMSLGLLTGLLLGLSVAQVVGGVIGALTALLAAFFGLAKASDALQADVLRAIRIAGFSVACTLGVLFGLTARTHGWLSASVQEQVNDWKAAGASQSDALAYVAYQQLGLVPAKMTASTIPAASRNVTGLFANHGVQDCAQLLNARYDSASLRVRAMQQAGGSWAVFAKSLALVPADQVGSVADAGYQLVCGADQ
jgi:hypothetical protein